MLITLSFASLNDVPDIMSFLDKYWKKGHILSINKDLFLYEFQEGERINIALAKNEADEILGIFGFIKYNSLSLPDLAGSLWKVVDPSPEPLLGLKLREFVIKNIPHRFFSAPGAGLQTRPIYHVIRMQWHRMKHYFILNNTLDTYNVAKIPTNFRNLLPRNSEQKTKLNIYPIQSVDELEEFDFNSQQHIVPFKDLEYIKKRFINYPIYLYEIFIVKNGSIIINIVVVRVVSMQEKKIYRIVDFYGPEIHLPDIGQYFYTRLIANNIEYIDFVVYGLEEKTMREAGFSEVDFDSEAIIIPNYFEPFMQKNIPVYCVADQTQPGMHFRQCKADGDQDRPNQKIPDVQ